MGTIVSLALLVASFFLWPLAIAAVCVALLTAFLVMWSGKSEREAMREELISEARAEGDTARAQERERTVTLHARQREVLTVVDHRTKAAQESLSQVTTSLGLAEAQISTLRGDNEALKIENEVLKEENAELRTQLASTTAESDEDAAEVLALPRRTFTGDAPEWSDLEAPTVVNLDLLRLAAPLLAEVKRAHAN